MLLSIAKCAELQDHGFAMNDILDWGTLLVSVIKHTATQSSAIWKYNIILLSNVKLYETKPKYDFDYCCV